MLLNAVLFHSLKIGNKGMLEPLDQRETGTALLRIANAVYGYWFVLRIPS